MSGEEISDDPLFIHHNKSHQTELMTSLNQLRCEDILTDLSFDVKDQLFPCHKAVLCACSEKLRRRICNESRKDLEHHLELDTVLHLRGIDASSMSCILDYIYTGRCALAYSNVQHILDGAHELGIESLVDECLSYNKHPMEDASSVPKANIYTTRYNEIYLEKLIDILFESRCETWSRDVILRNCGINMPCHRIVLAACSPYFRAMFSHKMRESTELVVPIHDVDSNSMQLIINYMYTGKLHISNCTDVQSLMTTTSMFQIDALVEVCTVFIQTNILDVSNCFEKFIYTESIGNASLCLSAKEICMKQFDIACQQNGFLNLMKDQLIEFISSSKLHVKREEHVYEAVLRWIKFCPDERLTCLDFIMPHVKFVFMSAAYIENKVTKECLLNGCKLMDDLLRQTSALKSLPVCERMTKNPELRMRHYTAEVIVILGGFSNLSYKKVEEIHKLSCYDPVTCEWLSLPDLPVHNNDNVMSVTLSGLHGLNLIAVTKNGSQYIYEAEARHWQRRPLPYPHGKHQNVKVVSPETNTVLVLGDKAGPFLYNRTREMWHELPKLRENCLTATICEKKVFAVINNQLSSCVLQTPYGSPHTFGWSSVYTFLQCVESAQAVTIGNNIFILINDFQLVCHKTKHAKTYILPGIPTVPRISCTLVCCNKHLYILGGRDVKHDNIDAIEMYDFDSKTWSHVDNMPNPVWGHCCVTASKFPYYI
ncbi:kelch-like protein 24 [Saccoglossus kowalevskii]|uniref:Kelch-like protein 24-like n=1 Tax=Saccoglossus kowalevskii TaxID=10224 RepID=A0ABM0LUR7_SACKO|nr:PREDICTED: kelch-like protein 24-like [Saccoglossus kowalevskii]